MARIRYGKANVKGLNRSVKTYNHPTNGARYYVLLNAANNTWSIVDESNHIKVVEGSASTHYKMKIEARDGLEKLGVLLVVEGRNRPPTVKKVA